MQLLLVGGTHDGESHAYVGATIALPKKGRIETQWIDFVATDAEMAKPFDQDLEMYVAQEIHYLDGSRTVTIYIEVEQRGEAVRLEQAALACHARARDYAAEAAREECSPGVNRIFADWAYRSMIDAQILESRASALYRPREVEDAPAPAPSTTLH